MLLSYMTKAITFLSQLARTLVITLSTHPINEIGLKSSNFAGFFFFGISTLKELFTPLTILYCKWNSTRILRKSLFTLIENSLTNGRFSLSKPAIFELSQSHTTLQISSSENSLTNSQTSSSAFRLNIRFTSVNLILLAENCCFKFS